MKGSDPAEHLAVAKKAEPMKGKLPHQHVLFNLRVGFTRGNLSPWATCGLVEQPLLVRPPLEK